MVAIGFAQIIDIKFKLPSLALRFLYDKRPTYLSSLNAHDLPDIHL